MTNQAIEKSEISYIFKNLISYFLERQRLVALALLDVAPILLQTEADNKLSIDLDPYIELFQDKQAKNQFPQEMYQGIWKETWKYRVHGIGCKLHNRRTNEPLEWDASNLLAFRFDWFWQHLVWRSGYEPQDPFVQQAQKWLVSLTEVEVKQVLLGQDIIQIQQDGLCLLR